MPFAVGRSTRTMNISWRQPIRMASAEADHIVDSRQEIRRCGTGHDRYQTTRHRSPVDRSPAMRSKSTNLRSADRNRSEPRLVSIEDSCAYRCAWSFDGSIPSFSWSRLASDGHVTLNLFEGRRRSLLIHPTWMPHRVQHDGRHNLVANRSGNRAPVTNLADKSTCTAKLYGCPQFFTFPVFTRKKTGRFQIDSFVTVRSVASLS